VKIVDKANETFKSQPGLRALFLFDPELDYKEEIAEIESNGIEVLTVSRATGLKAKYRIEKEGDEKKFLVYCPFREPKGDNQQKFHLMDILYANKTLSLDPVDDLIEEYQLPKDLYDLIDQYHDTGLKYKKDRKPLKPILTPSLTERKLKIGLVQRVLGFSKVSPSPSTDETIAKLLIIATDKKQFQNAFNELKELELDSFLGRELSQFFELDDNNLTSENIKTAAQKLKYNLLVGPIDQTEEQDPYLKLQLQGQHVHSRLSAFLIDWKRNSNLEATPEAIIQELAEDVSEENLIEVYGADAHFGLPTKEVISAVLKYLVPLVKNQPKKVLNTLQNYRDDLRDEHSPIAYSVGSLWHMAVFYNSLKDHPVSELDTASEYIDAYQDHYHKVDYEYRKAVTAFKRVNDPHLTGDTNLDSALSDLLSFYQTEFIQKLNIGWQQRLAEQEFDFNSIDITKQFDFFEQYVASSDIKTAIIISDAFRFEAAQELFKVLKRDTKKVLEIEPMLASVPSHTGLGMANLLPSDELDIDSGDYIADGTKTGSTAYRKEILQKTDSEATAINAVDIDGMNRDELRELFKEFNTVYIYHNLIDTTGEQHATEKDVLNKVEETIEYLDNLIRVLNNANVYRFLVTADHGFNYMENKLDDATLEDFPDVKGKVKSDSRYVVAEEIPEDFEGYKFPLSATTKIKKDLEVGLPRAVNRFKHRGVGYHYVHGGASLQEVLVPVIEVNRKREDKGQKVDVRLVSNNYVITTGSAQIEVLQVQSVNEKRNPRVVKFGFYNDAKQLVSDEQEVVFEATSTDATLRKKKILLTLTSSANELNHCTLMGFDEEDHNKLNPIVNQRYTIRTLMGKDDFES